MRYPRELDLHQTMLDPDLRHYLKAAQGDEPPARLDDPRWAETEALARRLIETSAAEAALRALEQEPARKKRWDLLLLAGRLYLGLDERSLALDALEVVGDKLLAAEDREGVLAILHPFLEPEPSTSAVRFLHFLAKTAPDLDERIERLREAVGIRPGDAQLHGELAASFEEAEDEDASREHRLRSMELHLDAHHAAAIEETLLRAVEEDLSRAPARIGRILLRYAAAADWADAEPLLELALPELERKAAGRLTWEDVAPIGPKVPARAAPRTLAARLLAIVVAREPEPKPILEGSGIGDPSVGFDQVAARLPKILALPPGAYVTHQSWGIGRVRASDGETLSLDFPGRSEHKMSFAMASRSLDRLPPDGLRVLAIEDASRARALADEGSAEILVRALRDVGGVATQAQLKPRLESSIPGYDWSAYWKRAKGAWKADPRIDSSEGYRGSFRLAPEGAENAEVALPPLAPRAAASGLQLLKKFLREHPEEEPRLKDHAGAMVARWADDARLDVAGRAQALCYAATWHAVSADAARRTLDDLVGSGLRPDDLTLGVHQEQLLDLAHGAGGEEAFLWRAAESRLPRLRERGRARLREMLGDERYAKAIETRIARPGDENGLATRLIEHFTSKPRDAGAPGHDALLLATIRLLERDLAEGLPERLLALLDEGGVFEAAVRQKALAAETAESIERTVVHWAGSERRLVPVLEFLHRIGMGAVSDEFERRRKARAEGLLEGKSTEDVETQFVLMSRATYDRLQEDMKRLALELKTSIPAAIEKARQLGDLSENAEYEAAKHRQANAATRLQQLMNTIQRSRLIENLEVDESRVGVGTESRLAPLDEGGEPMTLWILGEGDNALGPGILSYRAPLARPLLGKGVGAEVTVPSEEGPRRYRIESIRRRLPGDPETAGRI
ncbi:MAG: GreA/GreB family elongation factor [Hyphomicrobiales bacterium]